MRNVRLKREEDEKKLDTWRWRDNPFVGTRELDGLRVMMAVINNWDLKDENNAIREEKRKDDDGEKRVYEVSDLGASFGTTGRGLSHTKSKGNLRSYSRSKFIKKERPDFVDFNVPSRPELLRCVQSARVLQPDGDAVDWARHSPSERTLDRRHAWPAFARANSRCFSIGRI